MFNSSQFNQITFNHSGRRTLSIGKVLLLAKDQAISIVERITLIAKDLRNFTSKSSLMTFDIMGLAVAARIKAVAREIKVRFRIK